MQVRVFPQPILHFMPVLKVTLKPLGGRTNQLPSMAQQQMRLQSSLPSPYAAFTGKEKSCGDGNLSQFWYLPTYPNSGADPPPILFKGQV